MKELENRGGCGWAQGASGKGGGGGKKSWQIDNKGGFGSSELDEDEDHSMSAKGASKGSDTKAPAANPNAFNVMDVVSRLSARYDASGAWKRSHWAGERGAPKKEAKPLNTSDMKAKAMGVKPLPDEEAEAFIASHTQLKYEVLEMWRKLSPELKRLIFNGGPAPPENENAVLKARMTKVHNIQPGDWICEGCGDFQFSKNDTCRKCHQPR